MNEETVNLNSGEYKVRELFYFEYTEATGNGASAEPLTLMKNILKICVSKNGEPIGEGITKLPFTDYMALVETVNRLHGWADEKSPD